MIAIADLLSQQTIERLGWTLIHFVWQAMAIALLLAVALHLLRRDSSNVRYIVSCLALALIVALPIVTMGLVEVSEPVAEASAPPARSAMSDVTPVQVVEVSELPVEPFDASPLEMADLTVRASWRERLVAKLEPTLPYLVLGWLVGVFGLSAWHLGGWAQLQRMKRRLTQEVAGPLRTTLGQLAERLGIRRAVTLLESAIVEVPTVVGWIKPVILLPASVLTGLNSEQLEAILAHELAHIRRCDYLVNILQTVVEILGFYHPAVWWVSHRIRDERENCCDDLAVRVCGDSVRYARALTHLEEMRHRGVELAVAATGGSLVGRIGRLIGRPAPTRNRFTWLPGLIALLLVASIVIPAALVLAGPAPAESDPVAAGLPTREVAPAEATVAAQPRNDGERQNQAKVLVGIVIAKVLGEATLDHETKLSVAAILADEDPQIASAILDADPAQTVTLGNILNKYVARKSLTPATTQALLDLLESQGYLKIQSKPQVPTRDNTQAVIKTVTEYPRPGLACASPPQYVELGTTVHVTPHVPSPISDSIRLEFGVTWTERAPQNQPDAPPTFRTAEIESTVTLLNNHCFSLLVEPDKKQGAEVQDPESLLVMLKPSIIPRRMQYRASVHDGAPTDAKADTGNGADRSREATATADSTGANLRQALLEVRTVVMQASDPSRDAVSTREVLVRDGREARIITMTGEQFALNSPAAEQAALGDAENQRPDSGVFLSITPHIGDGEDITFDIIAEVKYLVQPPKGSNTPIVSRRTVESTCAVRYGGTVAAVGLTDNPAGHEGEARREVAVFVTAHPVRDGSAPAAEIQDPESLLVTLTPSGMAPAQAPAEMSATQAQQTDDHPRHVLLDVRTLAMNHGDLLNLPIEWARPTFSHAERIQTGYVADPARTDSLLAAVSRLLEQGRVNVMSNPRVLALEGRKSRLRAVTQEWYTLGSV